MKPAIATALMLLLCVSTLVHADEIEFKAADAPDGMKARVRLSDRYGFVVSLYISESKTPKNLAIYAHSGKCDGKYQSTIPVYVINQKTRVKRQFTSEQGDLLDLKIEDPNSITARPAKDYEILFTELSGKSITLQEAGSGGEPTGRILGCWVHP